MYDDLPNLAPDHTQIPLPERFKGPASAHKPRILLLDCNLEYTKGESKTDMEVCLFAVCLLLVCLFACLLVFLFAWLFYFILFFPSLLADSSVPISNTRKHTHTLLPASRRLQCCTPAFFAVALVPLLGHSS